jgi:glycosyltransferase involved in cell wall biosynthesis
MRIPAIIHRCYRNSLLGTLAVTRVGSHFRQLFDSYPRYLTLIALTHFARRQMIDDGYSSDRIFVKANSVADTGIGPATRERRVVFIGRLTAEKGAAHIIEMARSVDAIFELIGDGPQEERLRAIAPRNVVLRGRLERHIVIERIKTAAVVAIPSRTFEGFPMVIPEAFSAGTPVIASRIGSLAEIVEDGVCGLTRDLNDIGSWKEAIRAMLDDTHLARSLGENCRRIFEEKYNNQENVKRLTEIYSFALHRAAKSEISTTHQRFA